MSQPHPNPFLTLPRPTASYHDRSYPAISPKRPELSLKGKTVLITGGASGIGLATSEAFAEAETARLVILGRRIGPLEEAKKLIEEKFPATKVVTYAASVTDEMEIKRIFQELGTIDVLVLNAGIVHRPAPVFSIDRLELVENFETNVFGQLNLIEAFLALPAPQDGAERTIICTSTAAVHMQMPGVAAYSASKLAMTYFMGSIAAEYGSKRIRTFTLHPAITMTPMAKDVLGLKEGEQHSDDINLPAHYAVWLCSSEADFLKGRFVWSNWDVEELKAKKDVILADPNQLTISLLQDKVVE